MILPDIETVIKEKVQKLDKFYDRIIRFKVVLESPHRSKRKGRMYHVHIDISVSGEELLVRKEPHEDLAVAIREAFAAARRQLQEFAALRRAVLKNPAARTFREQSKSAEDASALFLFGQVRALTAVCFKMRASCLKESALITH